jgi:hypothetical protein
MSQASPPDQIPPAKRGAVVLAAGGKFFVRRVSLAPDGDGAAQVALALEGLAPFPASQLFFGFRTNAARTQALVFAAFRKNFSPEETAAWTDAAAVLPDFAVWLASGGVVPAASIWLREHDQQLELIAWDGTSELPAAVLVRPEGAVDRDELLAEARQKTGLADGVPVKIFKSAVVTAREKRELVVRLATGGGEARFSEVALSQADVRDKAVLLERQKTLRRDALLWRGFVGILGGLAACVVLELGVLGAHTWLGVQQGKLDALAPLVKKIDQAQGMAKRLEEISVQRLRPFEMLAEINEKRPKSVEYSSVNTKGLWQLDIQAQSSNAADPGLFEADIRRLTGVEKVELRDQRTREGTTTFALEVTFKPGWFKGGGV